MHAGVDIAAPAGSPVRAPSDGIVVAVERQERAPFRGYGPGTVVLQGTDGIYHLLAHVWPLKVDPRTDRFSPGVGSRVKRGDLVAQVAQMRGPHLHWETRHAFIAPQGLRPVHITVNPLTWLGRPVDAERPQPREDAWLVPMLVILYLLH